MISTRLQAWCCHNKSLLCTVSYMYIRLIHTKLSQNKYITLLSCNFVHGNQINSCTVSGFISESSSRAGFDGFKKPVSDSQIGCIKPPNPKLASVRFWQIEYALNNKDIFNSIKCHLIVASVIQCENTLITWFRLETGLCQTLPKLHQIAATWKFIINMY